MSNLANEIMKSLKAWQLFCIRKVISKVYTNNKQKTTCFDKSFFVWRNQGRTDLNHQMQLSGGQLPATARRSRTLIFLSKGKKNVTNLAGTCIDERCLTCTPITGFDIFLVKDVKFFIYDIVSYTKRHRIYNPMPNVTGPLAVFRQLSGCIPEWNGG